MALKEKVKLLGELPPACREFHGVRIQIWAGKALQAAQAGEEKGRRVSARGPNSLMR